MFSIDIDYLYPQDLHGREMGDQRRPNTGRPHTEEREQDPGMEEPYLEAPMGTALEKEKKKPQSLDDFMANHTSEDNESFDDIQEAHHLRHRVRKAWMYKVLILFLDSTKINFTCTIFLLLYRRTRLYTWSRRPG